MSFTATANSSLKKPAIPKRSGHKRRDVAGRRAVIVDGSLQVGDTSRGCLTTSPSFSPAYLLAALEWAEGSENRQVNVDALHDKQKLRSKPPAVVPGVLAHKRAPKVRPRRRNDDVPLNKPKPARCNRPGPTTPRIDVLPEKLVFPSRRTPASFLPTPSSLSLDTAVKPVFFGSSSPISPRSPLQHHREHRAHRGHQQQRPRTSNEGGRRRWHHDAHEEALLSADDAAQTEGETDRNPAARNFGVDSADGRQAMYQSMQPSGRVPQPSSKSPSSPRQTHGPVREAFAFLSRGRNKSFTSGSPPSTLKKRSRTLPISSTSTSAETNASDFCQSPSIQSVSGMPLDSTEALNPTAKAVTVRCKGTSVTVQVTKETSTRDLLAECSRSLAKSGRTIDPETCVAIESCYRPSLERRLRRYELIWDVISAWDHDSRNTLIVLPDAADADCELSLSSVSKSLEKPEGFVLPLYFCQRPGKWSQRYITLKENGQMFASKKENWKSTDKDVARLCHLTDFDLYLPTEAEMRKQLRPPKRYCYAVRSQEKASLFVDSNHYVHFFCTEDPNVARQFRTSVQGWRSWYLVNKKLRLHEEPVSSPPRNLLRLDQSHRGRGSIDNGFRERPSVDLSSSTRPHQSRDGTPPDASAEAAVPPMPPLPTSLRGKGTALFAATGLLGSGYDERKQQVLQDVTTKNRQGTVTSNGDEGPFVNGPSLLNSHAATAPTSDGRPRTAESDGSYRTSSGPVSPQQSSWFPSAVQHSAEQRNARPAAPLSRRPSNSSHAPSRARSIRHQDPRHPPLPLTSHHQNQPPVPQPSQQQQQSQQQSRRGPPQPLIDLTPTFVEPPQWSRENRGRGVRAPQGKPLVDLATGPVLPPSTAARFRDAAAPPKSLVRRPEPPVSVSGRGGGGGGGIGGAGTLMQQYELQRQQQQQGSSRAGRGRGNTLTTEGLNLGGSVSGSGLVRRNTVKSSAGSGSVNGSASAGHSSSRPGTSGGGAPGSSVPPPLPGSSAAAAYVQNRGRVMGVSDADRERVKERLRSVEGRGRGVYGEGALSLRGKR